MESGEMQGPYPTYPGGVSRARTDVYSPGAAGLTLARFICEESEAAKELFRTFLEEDGCVTTIGVDPCHDQPMPAFLLCLAKMIEVHVAEMQPRNDGTV